MLFGSNNRFVIPASISFGAVFMLVIDTVARSATAAEIPVSILTATVGAPFFIFLLKRTGGAWT
jgi:iron complex transport system permease protein